MFDKKTITAAAGLVLALSMGSASASIVIENIGGTAFSCDLPGDACNWTVDVDLGTALGSSGSDVSLDGLGWDLTIETVGMSWLEDAVISFQSPAGNQLFSLTAGSGDTFPGIGFYSSAGNLIGCGDPVVDLACVFGSAPLISGGILTLEFFEAFEDAPGMIEAFYRDPSFLTFDASLVSEPAIVALFGFGLLGLGLARRRRS